MHILYNKKQDWLLEPTQFDKSPTLGHCIDDFIITNSNLINATNRQVLLRMDALITKDNDTDNTYR